MQQISFSDSKINSSFESMVDSIKVQGNEFVTLITEFQQNAGNKEKQASLKKSISELDFRRKDLFNRLKKEHPEQEIHFLSPLVCMCATMYRIDLAHLCWSLENIVRGTIVNQIHVKEDVARWSLIALERMLTVR